MNRSINDRVPALCLAFAATLLAAVFAASARAQNIDTDYLRPAPNGTSLVEISGAWQHPDSFRFSNGQSIPNTSIDQYSMTVRYAHYFYVADHPAGFQIFQTVGYGADWRFDGFNNDNASGMRKLQASNTTLSAFFWPYANQESQTYVYTDVYLTPPDAGYSRNNAFSVAFGGWQGDAQIGVLHGFGQNLSLEAAFDGDFHGREDVANGFRRTISPTWRLQVWANWDWRNGLRTSLGYAGTYGGVWTDSVAGFDANPLRDADSQTLRAAVSYWWTPRLQTSFELDHNLWVGGGYQLGVGATGRVKVLF